MPTLATFRELPIIAMLQGSPTTAETSKVSHTLQKISWVQDQLDVQLKKWVQDAKAQLGAVLGFPNWKTASNVVLHPCDRLTARFRCKRCPRLSLKYLNDGCFDFAGACVHECVGMSKSQTRHRKTWDPDKFAKDGKVSLRLGGGYLELNESPFRQVLSCHDCLTYVVRTARVRKPAPLLRSLA